MGKPILQKIVPSVANPGLLVQCWGHNFYDTVVRLSDGYNSLDLDVEIEGDKQISFIVPLGTDIGDFFVSVISTGGESESIPLRVIEDKMLGFKICLPERTDTELAAQVVKMQPRGRAWNTDTDSNWYKLILSVVQDLVRGRQNACLLRREMTPSLTELLIDEQENEYGLPEPCNAIVATTLEERQRELIRKVSATGGNTKTYFSALMAKIGLSATITEDTGTQQFTVGSSRVGDRIWGEIWLFTWYVTIHDYDLYQFMTGEHTVGTPLQWWGNAAVQCLFNRLKPKHTNVVLLFGEPSVDEEWYDVDDDIELDVSDVDESYEEDIQDF